MTLTLRLTTMKLSLLYYLLTILCLLQAITSEACTATSFGSISISPTVSVPARDAPLITPLGPWSSPVTMNIFSGCNDGVARTVLVYGPSSFYLAGYYVDPADGKQYAIYTQTGFPAGVGFIGAAGPDASNLIPVIPEANTGINNSFDPGNTNYITITTRVRLIRHAPLANTAPINLMGLQVAIFKWKYATQPYASNPNAIYITGNATYTNTLFQTCSVTASNLQIKLPNINSNQLNSINSTTGNTAFSLPLNCPSPVNLYMTITDISAPGQTSNIVSL
uniref:fimbrial protein n=1 Tax=Aquitalea pelogenes TaxID=1293573 RepID=UPI00137ADAA3